MRKLFSLIAAVLFAGSMMADSYTITFKEGSGETSDGSAKQTTIEGIISDGAQYVSEVAATEVYNARIGRGIKLGTGSKTGSLVLTLATPVKVTSIVVNARKYNDTEKTLIIQDKNDYELDGGDAFQDYTYTYASATEVSSITLGTVTKRNYLKSVTVNYEAGTTPPPAETKPTTAPALPTRDEANVMGIYCSHYTTNNANFQISGWAGGYETLDLAGTKACYWTGMTWECIIDPVNTDAAHDYSAYENVHVDMWAPAAAKIKLTAEAVAGGNYKDGQVIDLAQGWNSIDIAIADWAGNYDFKNLKCFALEGYKTPADESFEGNPFAIANLYFWNTPAVVVPQYEVAEAIAAGLAEDDEILVRGVITKMEFKGKNFAKYGSVNIYVKDATGAEGEFEFFNCYSLNADTFKTSSPEYDATSTAWASFDAVTDGNGNTINVGDTVIAYGKYTLYNSTVYELKQGCYLVDVKKPGSVTPGETIDVVATSVRWSDYTATEGWWQIYGTAGEWNFSISNISATEAPGTYTMAEDLDPDWTYLKKYDEEDEVVDSVYFVGGQVVVAISAEGVVTVVGALVGENGNTYNFNLTYKDPVAETTVNIEIPEWQVADTYFAYYGIFAIAGEAANGDYVQLDLVTDGETIAGVYTEEDEDPYEVYGSGIVAGGAQQGIFSFTATIEEQAENGRAIVTADILCFNNTLYHVTTLVGEGVDNIDAAMKAIKSIVNGQLLIEKNGKTYNAQGAVVR